MTLQTSTDYHNGLNAIIDGEEDLAVELLSKAVSNDTDLLDAYFQLAKLFIKRNEVIRGQKILRDLLLRKTNSSAFIKKIELELIKAYLSNKNFSQAQIVAEKRLTQIPDDTGMRLTLTQILERQGEYEKAEPQWKIYAKLSRIDPNPRLALYRVERLRKNDLDSKAKKNLLTQAIKLDAKCAPAYMYLARLYREQNKKKKIFQTWELLLENVPEKAPWVFQEMESYLYQEKEYDKLLGIYQNLSHIEGKHEWSTHLALARHYRKMGKPELAKESIEKLYQFQGDIHYTLKDLISCIQGIGEQELTPDSPVFTLLSQYFENQSYVCSACQHKQNTPEWHCSQCGAWNSYSK